MDSGLDTFDLEAIRRAPLLRQLFYYERIESTNSAALELVRRQNVTCPALLLADEQTAGRGRGSNRWWSARGALTCSLILEPPPAFERSRWPSVALAAAVAICRAAAEFVGVAGLGIRWPNDVYHGDKKIAGILVEVPAGSAGGGQKLVLGIGFNVNNALAGAPAEVAARATSLVDIAGHPFALTQVLLKLLEQLAVDLRRLAEGAPSLVDEWQSRCLLRGRRVVLAVGEGSIRGLCQGIADDGALLMDAGEGPRRFFGGVVSQVD
jgi:BirA family biotin operon repressor/biotin-[acetyl-CoA-carboxylase] ligase